MRSRFERVDAAFGKIMIFFAFCTAVSIGVFAILVVFDLFLRRLRWGGLEWLNEGAEYALYAGVFLSAAWVLRRFACCRTRG